MPPPQKKTLITWSLHTMCYFYSYNASDTSTHINKQQFDKSSSDKDHLMVKALSMKELLHHRNTTVLCLAVLPPQTKGTQRTAWLGHSHGHDWHTFRLPQLWQNPCCVWETSWFPRLWQSLVCVCVCVWCHYRAGYHINITSTTYITAVS
jgi:hypothetical protein